MRNFSIIVALDEQYGIGKDGGLPWHLSGDLKHFKEVTTHVIDPKKNNAVIMGRKTWESLPEKFRPLPQRLNIVLSRRADLSLSSDVLKFQQLDEALTALSEAAFRDSLENVFVIGGGEIFRLAVDHPQCRKLYITHIQKTYACDSYFPAIPIRFKVVERSPMAQENGLEYFFAVYEGF